MNCFWNVGSFQIAAMSLLSSARVAPESTAIVRTNRNAVTAPVRRTLDTGSDESWFDMAQLGGNRIEMRILVATLWPARTPGSNFHFLIASRAGDSKAVCDDFSTRGLAILPVESTTKITVTQPSTFLPRISAG